MSSMSQGYPTYGFEAYELTLEQAKTYITKHVWSNIIWAGGSRGEEYFSVSYFCALDVDEGPGINESVAKLSVAKLQYILGTTKSHGIEKSDKPACDRYRILIPWEVPIWDLDIYRWNMKKAIAWLGSDPAYDGSRIWQPCQQIVSQGDGGFWPIDWDIPEEETLAYRQDQAESWAQWRRENQVLPPQTMDFLLRGADTGNRNRALYFAAVSLLEFGHPVEVVREYCRKAPGMKHLENFETTLKSACRKVGEGYYS